MSLLRGGGRRFGLRSLCRWIGNHQALSILIFLWVIGLTCTLATFRMNPIWDRDYLNYWFAPQAIRASINPYDTLSYRHYGLAFFPKAIPSQFNFTYPPQSLFLFWPLSYLPADASWLSWGAISLIAFWLVVRRILPKGLPSILAVLSPATILCLNYGQTSLIAGSLFLLA